MPVPDTVGLHHAAGLPEVACTVWSNLVMTAHLAGQLVLIHGGASGVGTHAIQVARALGSTVAVTAGSATKLICAASSGPRSPSPTATKTSSSGSALKPPARAPT